MDSRQIRKSVRVNFEEKQYTSCYWCGVKYTSLRVPTRIFFFFAFSKNTRNIINTQQSAPNELLSINDRVVCVMESLADSRINRHNTTAVAALKTE